MVLSRMEIQRRWRSKQEKEEKKQVAVMLSKPAYNRLTKIREHTGHNYSVIINKALMALSMTTDSGMSGYGQREDQQPKSLGNSRNLLETFFVNVSGSHMQFNENNGRIQSEALLAGNEKKFQFILDNCRDVISWTDPRTFEYRYVSPSAKTVHGYPLKELKELGPDESFNRLVHPDDQKNVENFFLKIDSVDETKIGETIEYRFKHRELGYRWMSTSRTILLNKKNEPMAIVGITRDIHRLKQTELALQRLQARLEQKVKSRTISLEKANVALTLMLKKEQEVRTEFEDKLLANLKELVLPYLEKLKITRLDGRQRKFLSMMELNLNKIVSPFLRKLSSKFLSLTPSEIQVADLIRHGNTTKEIAELLSLSVRTIECHRANVRKKIGIKNERTSLRSHLMSFE